MPSKRVNACARHAPRRARGPARPRALRDPRCRPRARHARRARGGWPGTRRSPDRARTNATVVGRRPAASVSSRYRDGTCSVLRRRSPRGQVARTRACGRGERGQQRALGVVDPLRTQASSPPSAARRRSASNGSSCGTDGNTPSARPHTHTRSSSTPSANATGAASTPSPEPADAIAGGAELQLERAAEHVEGRTAIDGVEPGEPVERRFDAPRRFLFDVGPPARAGVGAEEPPTRAGAPTSRTRPTSVAMRRVELLGQHLDELAQRRRRVRASQSALRRRLAAYPSRRARAIRRCRDDPRGFARHALPLDGRDRATAPVEQRRGRRTTRTLRRGGSRNRQARAGGAACARARCRRASAPKRRCARYPQDRDVRATAARRARRCRTAPPCVRAARPRASRRRSRARSSALRRRRRKRSQHATRAQPGLPLPPRRSSLPRRARRSPATAASARGTPASPAIIVTSVCSEMVCTTRAGRPAPPLGQDSRRWCRGRARAVRPRPVHRTPARHEIVLVVPARRAAPRVQPGGSAPLRSHACVARPGCRAGRRRGRRVRGARRRVLPRSRDAPRPAQKMPGVPRQTRAASRPRRPASTPDAGPPPRAAARRAARRAGSTVRNVTPTTPRPVAAGPSSPDASSRRAATPTEFAAR